MGGGLGGARVGWGGGGGDARVRGPRASGVGDAGRARTQGGKMEGIFRLFFVCLMQAIP